MLINVIIIGLRQSYRRMHFQSADLDVSFTRPLGRNRGNKAKKSYHRGYHQPPSAPKCPVHRVPPPKLYLVRLVCLVYLVIWFVWFFSSISSIMSIEFIWFIRSSEYLALL